MPLPEERTMPSVATKIVIAMGLLSLTSPTVIADEPTEPGDGPGIGGTYLCENCNPHIPGDRATELFIISVVNQDVASWNAGDTVTIRNLNGDEGVWGRINAYNEVVFISSGKLGGHKGWWNGGYPSGPMADTGMHGWDYDSHCFPFDQSRCT